MRRFYSGNLTKLNNKALYGHEIPHLFTYSDASNTGVAPIYKENCKLNTCNKSNKVFFRFNEKFIEKQTRKVAHR